MRNVLRESKSEDKHFFLGGTELALAKLVVNVFSVNPDLQIAGSYSPAFGLNLDLAVLDWINRIRDTDATIVWVGLGTPKQDFATYQIARATGCQVVAVGAAFDYLAGTVREAPIVWQKVGLEWLYRFAIEPRRLARRYLLGNLVFCYLLITNRIKASD